MTSTASTPAAERSANPAAILRARSVVASYGREPALKGVSLQLQQGEILAVTGPSGSGKSTLLMCLAGILPPDAGDVFFGDRRISGENEACRSRLRRREFGVLFQFGQLVPELSAVENIALPLLLDGKRRSAAMTTAMTWLERFDVEGLADTRPPQMSGGQAQRVAIARAMVTEPEILFADEPTGALDTLNGEQVMTQVTRVVREAGTSVVVVTHDARIAAYGDREVQLLDGQLVEAPVGHTQVLAEREHS